VRTTDIVGRISGDEFAVALSAATAPASWIDRSNSSAPRSPPHPFGMTGRLSR
jgi:GGDEF domain-containing protein